MSSDYSVVSPMAFTAPGSPGLGRPRWFVFPPGKTKAFERPYNEQWKLSHEFDAVGTWRIRAEVPYGKDILQLDLLQEIVALDEVADEAFADARGLSQPGVPRHARAAGVHGRQPGHARPGPRRG